MCPSNSNSAAFIIPIKSTTTQKDHIEAFFTVTGDDHQESWIFSWIFDNRVNFEIEDL